MKYRGKKNPEKNRSEYKRHMGYSQKIYHICKWSLRWRREIGEELILEKITWSKASTSFKKSSKSKEQKQKQTHKTKSKTTNTYHSQTDENQTERKKILEYTKEEKTQYRQHWWKKERLTQMNKIRNKKGSIITHATDIKKIVREY